MATGKRGFSVATGHRLASSESPTGHQSVLLFDVRISSFPMRSAPAEIEWLNLAVQAEACWSIGGIQLWMKLLQERFRAAVVELEARSEHRARNRADKSPQGCNDCSLPPFSNPR
jgi:hypothetical protein